MGHKQFSFTKTNWKFRYNHGGSLRRKRLGRFSRPLSTKKPIHMVFKAQRQNLRRGYRSPLGFAICSSILKRYSKRFFVKIEEQAICNDHIHLIVRLSRRSLGQHFMRVVAGQIAQQLEKNGFLVTDTPNGASSGGRSLRKKRKIWKHRPFTRVVQGWRPYLDMKSYVRLNEKEACGEIKYKKERLRGLSMAEWQILWA